MALLNHYIVLLDGCKMNEMFTPTPGCDVSVSLIQNYRIHSGALPKSLHLRWECDFLAGHPHCLVFISSGFSCSQRAL